MTDTHCSPTPMPAPLAATVTSTEAPSPPADPLPVFVPPSVMDPVSNLDFLPVDDAFALEMRAETIEQLVGGDALRRGVSERIEAGRSQTNADLVAGRERVRVHGSLHEHTGHGLAEVAAHLHTTVDGTLDIHAASEDTVLLAGHMRDLWDGGAAIVAAMTDDTVAGGGIRVTTPLDLWMHGLMGVEERIGTCTADAVLMESSATHYEREYGPGVHAAGLAVYTGSLYQSSRSSFRPLMRVSSGVRNLIAGGGGGGGGGDAGAGDAPDASPPAPAPAAAGAGTQAVSETLSVAAGAGGTAQAGVMAGARSQDLTGIHRSDAVAALVRGANVDGACGDLTGLRRGTDTAGQLAALHDAMRGAEAGAQREVKSVSRVPELDATASVHEASALDIVADNRSGATVPAMGAPVLHRAVSPPQPPPGVRLGLLGGADRPPRSATPESDFFAVYRRLRDIRDHTIRLSRTDIADDVGTALDRVHRIAVRHFESLGWPVEDLAWRAPGMSMAEEAYRVLQDAARQADDDGNLARAGELREALEHIDHTASSEWEKLTTAYGGLDALSTQTMQLPPATGAPPVAAPSTTMPPIEPLSTSGPAHSIVPQVDPAVPEPAGGLRRWTLDTYEPGPAPRTGFVDSGPHHAGATPQPGGLRRWTLDAVEPGPAPRTGFVDSGPHHAGATPQPGGLRRWTLDAVEPGPAPRTGFVDSGPHHAGATPQPGGLRRWTLDTYEPGPAPGTGFVDSGPHHAGATPQPSGLGRGRLDPSATTSGATAAHPAAPRTTVTPSLGETSSFWLQPVDPVPAPGSVPFDSGLHHAGEAAQPDHFGRGRLDPSATDPGAAAASSTAPGPGAPYQAPTPEDAAWVIERALLPGWLPEGFDASQLNSEAGRYPELGLAVELAAGRLPLQTIDELIAQYRAADAGGSNALSIEFLLSLKEIIERGLDAANPGRSDPQWLDQMRELLRQRDGRVWPNAATASGPTEFASASGPPGFASNSDLEALDVTEIDRLLGTLDDASPPAPDPAPLPLPEAPVHAEAGAVAPPPAAGPWAIPNSRREEIARRFGTEDALLEAKLTVQLGGVDALGWSTTRWRSVLDDLRWLNAIVESDSAATAAMADVDWFAIDMLVRLLDATPSSTGDEHYPKG